MGDRFNSGGASYSYSAAGARWCGRRSFRGGFPVSPRYRCLGRGVPERHTHSPNGASAMCSSGSRRCGWNARLSPVCAPGS